MNEINIILGLTYICIFLACVLTSIPLLKRKIKMNYIYGIKIKKAYSSEQNWYKINEYGAKRIILWSPIFLIFAIFGFFIEFGANYEFILIFAIAPICVLIIPIIEIFKFAKKL